MRDLTKSFLNKTIDYQKLLKYGFLKINNYYVYENNIYDNHFKVVVEISKDIKRSKVVDLVTNQEYILVDIKDADGSFVYKVREEYQNILNDIIKNCSVPNVFKSVQAKKVIKYVNEKYNDDLEYLWEKFPNNAIFRNKNNNKWYALLLVLPESKLKLKSEKIIDVLNLRYTKNENIINNQNILEGYHMNKKNWITIKLDGSVNLNKIYKLIDNSYNISLKK